MPKKWLQVDTRQLGRDRSSKFDGFLHLLPKKMAKRHFVDIGCWCEPRLIWPEGGATLLVSHRDVPADKEKR